MISILKQPSPTPRYSIYIEALSLIGFMLLRKDIGTIYEDNLVEAWLDIDTINFIMFWL